MLNFIIRVKRALYRRIRRILTLFYSRNKNSNILEIYNNSKRWIHTNSIENKGIIVSNEFFGRYKNTPYPEVSGYYIPSLLEWGEKKLAFQYTKWLCSIQKKDGSWFDYLDKAPYVFDSGQILKGLISIYPIMPEIKENIIKGCDWIVQNIQSSGRLTTPSTECWNDHTCSELIHIYCLSPLIDASELFGKPEYKKSAQKCLNYYKKNYYEKLVDFHTLSHFYLYIVEALVDLGEIEIANKAIDSLIKLQEQHGFLPAYKDVEWVCSTGVFQFAVVCYKLGKKQPGDKAFDYACKLQLKSGGWLGSYGSGASYSVNEEISWCNKYFLDALALKLKSHFSNTVDLTDENVGHGTYALDDHIDKNDGRITTILELISSVKPKNLLEVGCGKGRLLKHIHTNHPKIELYGLDVHEDILSSLPKAVKKHVGSILNTGYKNEQFDLVCVVEALEHALDIENALEELVRITKTGGTIIIIDKNKENLGAMEMPSWEQWFDVQGLKTMLEKNNVEVIIKSHIPYDNQNGSDGLFVAWIGVKK